MKNKTAKQTIKKQAKFAVYDCETDPFLHGRPPAPFIWGYYDGLQFKTFRDTTKFAAFLSSQKVTAYAHNGGKFDAMFLLDHINNYEKPTIINGRLSKCRIGKCTILDSYNILPIALSDYQKTKIDYSKFEAEAREQNMPEIIDYLRDDCLYLYDLVQKYRDEYGADLTQAGGAMKTFQKMHGAKAPRHTDAGTFANFKQFYHGGRVQCFQSGVIEKKFSLFDINSAYPFAMIYRHPFGMSYAYGSREMPFTATERVFYRLECVSRGALPWREKPNSALSFPNDNAMREFFVTDWEYWTAKNAKLISHIKIIECVLFDETLDFNEYVTRFYTGRKQAKLDGDKAKDLLYKLRLNSLYGKFGSDYRKYENYIILPKNFDSSDYGKIDSFGNENALFSKPLSDDEMKFYNVATSASITGFVRAYLLAAMVNIGFENLLYCDTDCIATLRKGNLRTGGDLGAWGHEGDFTKAGIAGKKLYIFQGENGEIKKASKGAKLTDNDLWKICNGDTVKHQKAAPSFSVTGKVRFTERNIKITS